MTIPRHGRPATYRPEPTTDRLPTRRELLKLIDRQSWTIEVLTEDRLRLGRLLAEVAVDVERSDQGAAA